MTCSDENLARRAIQLLVQLGGVIYLQKFIDHEGFDLRLLAIGDRVIGMRDGRVVIISPLPDSPAERAGLQANDRVARIGMRPMDRVGRAIEKGETQGFMKIIVDTESEAILGAAGWLMIRRAAR